jgi:pimeloyl-ACP methyl ester carboxylesterase
VNLISNEPVTVLLDGSTLVETMFNLMYVSEIIPDIPSLIYQVKNGDYTYYAMLTAFFDAQTVYISEGMYYSVECNEEAPFNDPAVLQTAATENPEFADFILSDSSLQICQTWGSGTADPVENEPVTSDIPTLVFSGEYDPITPPAWGQAAADNLSHSYFFQIPGMGHGVSYSPGCPQDVLLEFLDDPTVEPDSSCISGMTPPDFENGGLF